MKDEVCNYFVFEFNSVNDNRLNYSVYSLGIEDMFKFLKHHNLMEFVNKVKRCDENGIEGFDDEKLIKQFSFKSNKLELKDRVFKIYTTDEIVNQTIDNVCERLVENLVLGPISNRKDIKFISIINDCINSLPHACILDIFDVNESEVDDSFGVSDALESIYDSVYSNAYAIDLNTSPITIESYVRHFSEMLFDKM